MAVSNPLLARTVLQLRRSSPRPWLHQPCILPSLRFNYHDHLRSFRGQIAFTADRKQFMQAFHTSRPLKAAHDSSAIDYVHMPQYELLHETPPEIMRIPLLPTNFFPSRSSHAHQEAVEPVIRPEISTVSADSTHIASPSAMSEVCWIFFI